MEESGIAVVPPPAGHSLAAAGMMVVFFPSCFHIRLEEMFMEYTDA